MQVNSIGRTSFGVQFSDSFKKALDNRKYSYRFMPKEEQQMYNNYVGALQVYKQNYKLNVEKDGSITLCRVIGKTDNGNISFNVLKNIHDVVLNLEA